MNRHRPRVEVLENSWCGSVTKGLISSTGRRTWRETVTFWVMSSDHRDDGSAGQLGKSDLHHAGDIVVRVIPIRFFAEPVAQIDRVEHLHADLGRERKMRQR